MRLTIPNWVPSSARDRIKELAASPLGQDEQAAQLLKRLATYDAMRTEVWEKLPSDRIIDRGKIVGWAFFAFTLFPRLPQPYPQGGSKRAWTKWGVHREKHEPLTDPAQLSHMAASLWEAVLKAKGETETHWMQFWEGDPTITPDTILDMLDALRAFYSKLHIEYQELLSFLPSVKRWNDKTPQIFFSDFLSDRISDTYGCPMDAVVAALEGVAFDLKNPTGPETIRGRRRQPHRKN